MDLSILLSRLESLRVSGADISEMCRAAVDGLHDLDERFHWTGIYELYPDDVLKLGPYIGAPTDHVFIGVGNGVCGTAVAERRNMNIPDVSKHANYLACSSDTKSELVVLIRDGDTIFGQIDIDSHHIAAFDDAVVQAVQVVADWLARAYAEQERRAA